MSTNRNDTFTGMIRDAFASTLGRWAAYGVMGVVAAGAASFWFGISFPMALVLVVIAAAALGFASNFLDIF